jgi:hypothetical protein
MSKAIKTFAIATVIATFASVAFAQRPPLYWGSYGYSGLPATCDGDAATNQYTSCEGVVDSAP